MQWLTRASATACLLPLAPGMCPPEDDLSGDAFPPAAGEPLVPILRLGEGSDDADALATWHQALSNALAADVPHDLLALWLYPTRGGAVLLGPEALAQDDLQVPLPLPQLLPQQLTILEEIVRDAGYASAVSLPIRFGRRDVGMMLVASLAPDRYRGMELIVLRLAAQRLAPSLGRLARQWGGAAQGAERVASCSTRCRRRRPRASRPRRSPQRSVGRSSGWCRMTAWSSSSRAPEAGATIGWESTSAGRLGRPFAGARGRHRSTSGLRTRTASLAGRRWTGGSLAPAATSALDPAGAELRAVVARGRSDRRGSSPISSSAAWAPTCMTKATPSC